MALVRSQPDSAPADTCRQASPYFSDHHHLGAVLQRADHRAKGVGSVAKRGGADLYVQRLLRRPGAAGHDQHGGDENTSP